MGLKLNIYSFLIFAVFIIQQHPTVAEDNNLSFTLNLLKEIVNATDSIKNIVISPLSIQSCLTLAYIGADGKTAEEISQGLQLHTLEKEEPIENFNKILSRSDINSLVKIANKIYLHNNVELESNFNKIAVKKFHSKAENIDFEKQDEAAKIINNWVEDQTNNKIRNLVQPSALEGTHVLLVNAIYFKGKWKYPFSTYATRKDRFYNNEKESVDVDMMFVDDNFIYGELEDLNAKVIQLPYNNSDIYMLIIVPNNKNALDELQNNIEGINFENIENKLKEEEVSLSLPKFRSELSIKLNDILREMGMKIMFTEDANFRYLTKGKISIDEVFHKAIIDVDEVGTEAAGATYLKAVTLSLNLNMKYLNVDRPFVYFIKDRKTVYFIGRISKF